MLSTVIIPPPADVVEITPFGRIHRAIRALRERASRTTGDKRARLLIAADAAPGLWAIAMVGLTLVGVRVAWSELAGQMVEIEPDDGVWRSVLEAPPSVELGMRLTVDALRDKARAAMRDHKRLTLRREGSKAKGDAIDVDAWELLAALIDLPPALVLSLAIVGGEGSWRRFLRASAVELPMWGAVAVPEMPREVGTEQLPLLSADVIDGPHEVTAVPTLARTAPAFHHAARGVEEVCRG